MIGAKQSAAALAFVVLLGGCADAGDDAELVEEAPVAEQTATDVTSWDQDGDGMLAGEEWKAYTTDRRPWHVWDANQSGGLEQTEFESGAVSGRAAGASFAEWDADGSGAVDGAEWEAAWLGLFDENGDGMVSGEELGPTG